VVSWGEQLQKARGNIFVIEVDASVLGSATFATHSLSMLSNKLDEDEDAVELDEVELLDEEQELDDDDELDVTMSWMMTSSRKNLMKMKNLTSTRNKNSMMRRH
jgi:hypothetical protein